MNNARTFSVHERLTAAAACLDRLSEERASCGDPTLDKVIEGRIISRELFDLELQDFDEQIGRLLEVAERLLTGA